MSHGPEPWQGVNGRIPRHRNGINLDILGSREYIRLHFEDHKTIVQDGVGWCTKKEERTRVILHQEGDFEPGKLFQLYQGVNGVDENVGKDSERRR